VGRGVLSGSHLTSHPPSDKPSSASTLAKATAAGSSTPKLEAMAFRTSTEPMESNHDHIRGASAGMVSPKMPSTNASASAQPGRCVKPR